MPVSWAGPPLSFAAHLRKDLIEKILGAEEVRSILEVGPGQGAMSFRMARDRTYVGYEPDETSYSYAFDALRGNPNATLVNSVLPARSKADVLFDALVAIEVLEHIEKDQEALVEWREWIRPGGVMLLTVPAHQARFSRGDIAVGHYRRYERDHLVRMLERSGLDRVEVYSYGFPFGFLLEAARNRVLARRDSTVQRDRASARSGRFYQPKRWSALRAAAMVPFDLLQRPFYSTNSGIGYVARGTVVR